MKLKATTIGVMLMLFLTSMSSNLMSAICSATTKVYVDPASILDPTLTPGSSFSVSVMVSDVEAEFGCYSWQVFMSFDSGVLECVNVTEGDFLKDQPEGTISYVNIKEDYALFGWSTKGKYLGVNGSGTLATVEFQVVGIGESVLNITSQYTYLLELRPPPVPPGEDPLREIPFTQKMATSATLASFRQRYTST